MAVPSGGSQALYQPKTPFDWLHVPGLGRLLRWRWGRLLFQLPLFLLAILMVYDGLTGPPLAPQNLAGVLTWVHYRGLVILALLLVGNLFCMSCPFTLPRTLAHRLSGRGRRWPQVLRNKWLAIAVLVLFFWAYEVLDLWASPWLTAWLIVGYFGAAFVLEALFAESPFCKYVCPLGSFNFVASTVSPFQVKARDLDVCRACVGKECVNGSAQVLGCGTELFVPQVKSNMDCVFCLDCARACPYDNVALAARRPLSELTAGSWPRRWDMAMLLFVFAFAGLFNAFGMVPPVYELQAWLAGLLPFGNEALILALILGVGMLVLPVLLALGAAWLTRRLAPRPVQAEAGGRGSKAGQSADSRAQDDGPEASSREPLRWVVSRFAPAMVPLAFAIWFAHYGFHFATGALTVVPVLQNFLIDHGITFLGTEPAWQLGPILPSDWLLPLEALIVVVGFFASLFVVNHLSEQAYPDPRAARLATLPWLVLLLVLAMAALAVFTQPMEMRGTLQFLG